MKYHLFKKSNHPIVICLGLILMLGMSCKKEVEKTTEKPQRPNILLIMADDLGYADIGCYGGEISTPNIDRLAAEGLRLTQCYNNGICAPSRASLLTGQYPHQTGIGFFNMDLKEPGYEGYLNRESLTFGEVFKEAGYRTYISGKWHLGNDSIHWPNQRGFDRFFGFLDGGGSYFDDIPIMKVIRNASLLEDGKRFPVESVEDFYMTDFLTEKGIQFIEEQEESDPFLLYMAYNAPHWPLHAKEQDITKYKGRYDIGWDSLRILRHKKQLELGVIAESQELTNDETLPRWNTLSNEEKASWTEKMEVYAAMVDNLDQNIGRLIDHLKSSNQLDNTLVLFVSDNGADDWDIQKIPVFYPSKAKVGQPGSNESYGRPWAHLSNVPFKRYKATPGEGGISSPFIARYPSVISANTLKKGGIHFVDFLPTLLEFADVKYPQQFNGTKIKPLIGENFMPLLSGENWERETPIFYEWGGNRTIRKENWKLVAFYPENEWQLFDLSTDRSEGNNLTDTKPVLVEELKGLYQEWAVKTGVVPWNAEMQKRTGFPPKRH